MVLFSNWKQVVTEYKDVGVTVYLGGCKSGVREMLEKGGFLKKYDKDMLFPTVHDAVIEAEYQHKRQQVMSALS